MLIPKTRYECNKCGAVVSAEMLKDQMADMGKNVICPFCRETPTVYEASCTYKLIGVFDHFNSTYRGHLADAVFIEDNGITNPRLVVRLSYDFMHDWRNSNKNTQPPKGFVVSSPDDVRTTGKPVEFMYEIKRTAVSDDSVLMDEIRGAVAALHEWITPLLV